MSEAALHERALDAPGLVRRALARVRQHVQRPCLCFAPTATVSAIASAAAVAAVATAAAAVPARISTASAAITSTTSSAPALCAANSF